MKENTKRLVVKVGESLFKDLKHMIIENNSSMQKWVLQAILEKMHRDFYNTEGTDA